MIGDWLENPCRRILEFYYGHHYCDYPPLPESITLKNSNINYDDLVKISGLAIYAEPNPASTWVALNYHLPENVSSATITIKDASGKVVYGIRISGEQGQKVWDVRNMKPGVYIFSIEAGSIRKNGKLIIK